MSKSNRATYKPIPINAVKIGGWLEQQSSLAMKGFIGSLPLISKEVWSDVFASGQLGIKSAYGTGNNVAKVEWWNGQKLTVHASFSNNSDEVRWSFDLRYNPTGQPTGRSHFPGFVARSRQHPETELRDAAAWESLWRNTRDHLATVAMGKFNRWDKENPVCA